MKSEQQREVEDSSPTLRFERNELQELARELDKIARRMDALARKRALVLR